MGPAIIEVIVGLVFYSLKTQINLQVSIINDPQADARDIDLTVSPIIMSLSIGNFF